MPLFGLMSPDWGGSSAVYPAITMSRPGKTISISWLALTGRRHCTFAAIWVKIAQSLMLSRNLGLFFNNPLTRIDDNDGTHSNP